MASSDEPHEYYKLMTKLSNFLCPSEEEESLVRCYKMAISKGAVRNNSVLHLIASHHYKQYMQRKASGI